MSNELEKYEQEIRQIILAEYKNHILYLGNEILEDNMTAIDFWRKLQQLCL
jgi:hypothetical protein